MDLKAKNIKVYNAGATGIYTGGIAGNDITGKNWTVDDVQVMAIGADSCFRRRSLRLESDGWMPQKKHLLPYPILRYPDVRM